MSKHSRIKEAKKYREARNEVLKSDDPTIWIDRDGGEVSLGMLMKDIDLYIYSSLMMDDNPLRHLRRSFPDFEWKFYEGNNMGEAVRSLVSADYIWMRWFGSILDDFITATQKGRKNPRVLCYREKDEYSAAKYSARLKAQVPGIRFVVNGSDTDMGTVID